MSTLPHRRASFEARFDRTNRPVSTGCAIDVGTDGRVVLVVDGERLFHFETLFALLEHYAPAPC